MKNIFLLLSVFCTFFLNAQYNVSWKREINGAHQGDYVSSMVSTNHNVYISLSKGSLSGLNVNGDIIFSAPSATSGINDLQVYNGFLYSFGRSFRKFDLVGNPISEKTFSCTETSQLPIDRGQIFNNNIYCTVFPKFIFKYDQSGIQLQETIVGSEFNLATIYQMSFADNHIYLCAVFANNRILKYDTLGNLKWNVNPGFYVSNIVTDATGNCYVLGASIDFQNYILKLDRDGKMLWNKPYDPMIFKNGMVKGDSLFVCGGSVEGMSTMMVLSSETGEVYSKQYFDLIPNVDREFLTQIYADGNEVYVGGYLDLQYPQAYVARLSDSRFVAIKEEQENNYGVLIFPNPSGSVFNISFTSQVSENVSVEVRNSLGQLVYGEPFLTVSSFGQIAIDLSEQVRGIYFAEIVADHKKSVLRLVKE